MTSAAGVILAAGAGRRLGTVAKALLRRPDGATLLEAVVRCADAAGVGARVVVVGPPHGLAVEAEARRLGVATVVNPRPEDGMASSVAVGFAYARTVFRGVPAALLWPVDHAAVAAATVARVVAAATTRNIAIPVYRGRGGHPTSFGSALWDELVACGAAADGARGVVRADPARAHRIDVDDPGVIADVDTPADMP